MNKRSFAIAALAVAGVIFSAGIAIADEADDEEMTGAGGGGWWMSGNAKNTFGFYLNPVDIAMSEFVLQARDAGVTVHAYQFDSVVVNYDATLGNGNAEAWGMAYVAGADVSFHLKVVDGDPDGEDSLLLELSGDAGTWTTASLGGGQIWVYME